jgi:hypothetical protein
MITYFFQNLTGKNIFAMTLYAIGSFFPALAARDRVKGLSFDGGRADFSKNLLGRFL